MAPKKSKTTTKKDKPEKVSSAEVKSNSRMRNCVATLNNYVESDVEKLKEFFEVYCWYGVFGKEVGESGTPHLQIYFELKSQMSLKQIRENNPNINNVQPRRSPMPKEAAGYCKKGMTTRDDQKPEEGWSGYFDTPHGDWQGFEHGKKDISSPGARTDLVNAAQLVKTGEKTVKELRQENPNLYHVYNRTLIALEADHLETKFRCGEMTECVWYHGKPGRGKSHAVFVTEMESIGGYNPEKVYDWNLDEEFQSYAGEEIIIINEYKGVHQIKYGTWLKMIDKWPYSIKRKNMSPFPLLAKKILVASVFHPTDIEWNLSSKDDLDQLLDRITIREVVGENRRIIAKSNNAMSNPAM